MATEYETGHEAGHGTEGDPRVADATYAPLYTAAGALRTYGYHISFTLTGVQEIDQILAAVAAAAKAHHHTEGWCEPIGLDPAGRSYVELIQQMADEAAGALRPYPIAGA